MRNNSKLFNYVLGLFFIILLILFLFSLVGLSRVVLSETQVISTYVSSTKDILEDVENIENSVLEGNFLKENIFSFEDNQTLEEINYINNNLRDKAFVTFTLRGRIELLKENIYVLVDQGALYSNNDLVFIKSHNQIARIVDVEDDFIEVYLFDSQRIVKIQENEILGYLLYIDKNEEVKSE